MLGGKGLSKCYLAGADAPALRADTLRFLSSERLCMPAHVSVRMPALLQPSTKHHMM